MVGFMAVAALLTALASETPAAGSRLSAIYDVLVGGLRAGELMIEAEIDGGQYRGKASFRTIGLIRLFADNEMEVESLGRINGEGLEPLHYIARTREGRDERLVRIRYDAPGGPTVEVTPPFTKRPWSIAPEDQGDALDPLSAILAVLTPRRLEEICGRRIEAFDGRHRFAFEIAAPEARESGAICRGRYLRIAGYKPKKMRSRNARIPFTLQLEPREDGSFQVVRLDAKTELGRAIVRLRR